MVATSITRARSGPSLLLLWLVAALLLSAAVSAQSAGVPATSVRLLLPSSVVYDAANNLYLAESSNHLVRKVDLLGMITTVAGTGVQGFGGDGGPATSASLDSPGGLAMNAQGDLFIADTHNHRVRRIDASTQQISTVAGSGVAGFSGDGGAATAAQMKLPSVRHCRQSLHRGYRQSSGSEAGGWLRDPDDSGRKWVAGIFRRRRTGDGGDDR